MKIVEQSVKVIYPGTIEAGINELRLIEIAGRNCWRSEGKMDEESYRKFIENLRKRGHDSPLEFAHIMYELVTSRDVMAELTRHRIGVSFCIQSQRYVDESASGDIEFIRPLFFKENPDDLKKPYADTKFYQSMIWQDQMENIEQSYKVMRQNGSKNQDARKVLPNSAATRIMMKVNLRELLHIYELRSSPAAYPEMVELMRLLKIETDKVFPGFLPEKG
jgi:thymidylate synthase (FAD)